MKIILFILSIACRNSLILQDYLEYLYEIVNGKQLISIIYFILSLFILIFGLRFKFEVCAVMITFLFTSAHSIFNLKDTLPSSYLNFIFSQRYLVFGISNLIFKLLIVRYRFLINLLYIYLIYIIHDLYFVSNYLIFTACFLAFPILIVYLHVIGKTNIVIAIIASIFGSFIILFTSQCLLEKDCGFLTIYKDLICANVNEDFYFAFSLQIMICIFSFLVQFYTLNKKL